jgi:hypothetical protein
MFPLFPLKNTEVKMKSDLLSELRLKVGPAVLPNLWTEHGCPRKSDPEYSAYQAALEKLAREVLGVKPSAAASPVPVTQAAAPSDAAPVDCPDALRTKSGALYLPWCAPIPADQVRVLMAELVELIEMLADYEAWPKSDRDEVLARAVRGPLADLMPNLHHFRERTTQARAEYDARQAARDRAWRADRDLTNRGYR